MAYNYLLLFSDTCTWVQVPMIALEYARHCIVIQMGAERKSATLSCKSQQSFTSASAGMQVT